MLLKFQEQELMPNTHIISNYEKKKKNFLPGHIDLWDRSRRIRFCYHPPPSPAGDCRTAVAQTYVDIRESLLRRKETVD
jgi:hypothetical protein